MTTRKCANCPVREATAMLARSAIRARTRFSRCLGGGEGSSVQKSSVSRSQSGNQCRFSPWNDDQMPPAVSFTRSIGANSRSRPKIVPTLVLSNRTILTLSCRHPVLVHWRPKQLSWRSRMLTVSDRSRSSPKIQPTNNTHKPRSGRRFRPIDF